VLNLGEMSRGGGRLSVLGLDGENVRVRWEGGRRTHAGRDCGGQALRVSLPDVVRLVDEARSGKALLRTIARGT